MRCVNCGRQAAPDDSACPYCGCPVLSRHADPVDERRTAEVRRLFDEAAGRPALHVVPLRPEAPRQGPDLADALLVLGFWTIAQAIPGCCSASPTSPGPGPSARRPPCSN